MSPPRVLLSRLPVTVAVIVLAGCGDARPSLGDDAAEKAATATLRAYEREDARGLCAMFSARERKASAKVTGGSCRSSYEALFAGSARARRGAPLEQASEALRASFLPGDVVGVERRAEDRVVVRVRQPPPQLTAEQRRAAIAGLGSKTFERALERRRGLVVPVGIVLEQGSPRAEISFRS